MPPFECNIRAYIMLSQFLKCFANAIGKKPITKRPNLSDYKGIYFKNNFYKLFNYNYKCVFFILLTK